MAAVSMGDPVQASHFGAEWLDRLRGGDERAFEALFRAFTPGLVAMVARYVRSRPVAEELVQELFLTLWRRRLTLDVKQGVSTYLYVAARNRALAHLRHERVVAQHAVSVVGRLDDPSSPADTDLLAMLDLQEAIEQLPAQCKLVFRLSRQQGMPNAGIAAFLDISVKTVEAHLTRALRILRGRLQHFS
jgi:RNA polymerase sigma-70 factor (ECF subfamily)